MLDDCEKETQVTIPNLHFLEEEYYGYVCRECGLFIPYGSEPWLPFDPDDCLEAYFQTEMEN